MGRIVNGGRLGFFFFDQIFCSMRNDLGLIWTCVVLVVGSAIDVQG